MFCHNCGSEAENDYKFCKGCGSKLKENIEAKQPSALDSFHGSVSATDVEIGEGKHAWYDTGWPWFWLVFCTPVGIYGFVKRHRPDLALYVWVGTFFIVCFSILLDGAG